VPPAVLRISAAHRAATSIITIVTLEGRADSPFPFFLANDPRVPDEVSLNAGYVNPRPPPSDFNSARLWGMAIADTRVAGYESAQIEVSWTQLSCRVDGKGIVLNEDAEHVRGGLYLRQPWFGGHDYHEPMPTAYDLPSHSVVLPLGQRSDREWHFWSPSPRAAIPTGFFRWMQGESACEDFCGNASANGNGLLAVTDSPVWWRRE
jgi:hypothetical protein